MWSCEGGAAEEEEKRRDPSEKQEPHTVMWGIDDGRRKIGWETTSRSGQSNWDQLSEKARSG